MSTSWKYHDACGGCHKYIGGCSVHWGIFNTSVGHHDACGGYHEYIGGCSVHRKDIMIHIGDVMICSVHRSR